MHDSLKRGCLSRFCWLYLPVFLFIGTSSGAFAGTYTVDGTQTVVAGTSVLDDSVIPSGTVSVSLDSGSFGNVDLTEMTSQAITIVGYDAIGTVTFDSAALAATISSDVAIPTFSGTPSSNTALSVTATSYTQDVPASKLVPFSSGSITFANMTDSTISVDANVARAQLTSIFGQITSTSSSALSNVTLEIDGYNPEDTTAVTIPAGISNLTLTSAGTANPVKLDATNLSSGDGAVTLAGDMSNAPVLTNLTNRTLTYTSTSSSANIPNLLSTNSSTDNTLLIASSTAKMGDISLGSGYHLLNLQQGTVGTINATSMGTNTTYASAPTPTLLLDGTGTMASIGKITTTSNLWVEVEAATQAQLPSFANCAGTCTLSFNTGADTAMSLDSVPNGYHLIKVKSGTITGDIGMRSMSTQNLELAGGSVTGTVSMDGGSVKVSSPSSNVFPSLTAGDNTLQVDMSASTLQYPDPQLTAGYKTVKVTAGTIAAASGATNALDFTNAASSPTLELNGGTVADTVVMSSGTVKLTGGGATYTLPAMSGSGNTLEVMGGATNVYELPTTTSGSTISYLVDAAFDEVKLTSDTLGSGSNILDMSANLTSPTLNYAGGSLGAASVAMTSGTVAVNTTTYPTLPTFSSDTTSAIAVNSSLKNTLDLIKAPASSATITPSVEFGRVKLTGDSTTIQAFSTLTLDLGTMTSHILEIVGDTAAISAMPTAITMSSGTVVMSANNSVPSITTGSNNTLDIQKTGFTGGSNGIVVANLGGYSTITTSTGSITGADVLFSNSTAANLAKIASSSGAISDLTLKVTSTTGAALELGSTHLDDKYTAMLVSGGTFAAVDMTSMSTQALTLANDTYPSTIASLKMKGGTLKTDAASAASGSLFNVIRAMEAANAAKAGSSTGNTLVLGGNVSGGAISQPISFGPGETFSTITRGSHTIGTSYIRLGSTSTALPSLVGTGNKLLYDGATMSVDLTGNTEFNEVIFRSGGSSATTINLGDSPITFEVNSGESSSIKEVEVNASIISEVNSNTLKISDANTTAKMSLELSSTGPFGNLNVGGVADGTIRSNAFTNSTFTFGEGYNNAVTPYDNAAFNFGSKLLGETHTLIVNDTTSSIGTSITIPTAFKEFEVQKATFGNIELAAGPRTLTLKNIGSNASGVTHTKVGAITLGNSNLLKLSGDTMTANNIGSLTLGTGVNLMIDMDASDAYQFSYTGNPFLSVTTFSGDPTHCIDQTSGTLYCFSKYDALAYHEVKDELLSRKILRTHRIFADMVPGEIIPYSSYETRGKARTRLPRYNNLDVGVAYAAERYGLNWMFDLSYSKAHIARRLTRDRYGFMVAAKKTLLPRIDMVSFAQLGYNRGNRSLLTTSSTSQNHRHNYASLVFNTSLKVEEYINDKDFKLMGRINLIGEYTTSYKDWLFDWRSKLITQIMPEIGVEFDTHVHHMPLKSYLYTAYNSVMSGLTQHYQLNGVEHEYRQRNFSGLHVGGEVRSTLYRNSDVAVFADYRSDKSYSAGIRFILETKRPIVWRKQGLFQNYYTK